MFLFVAITMLSMLLLIGYSMVLTYWANAPVNI